MESQCLSFEHNQNKIPLQFGDPTHSETIRFSAIVRPVRFNVKWSAWTTVSPQISVSSNSPYSWQRPSLDPLSVLCHLTCFLPICVALASASYQIISLWWNHLPFLQLSLCYEVISILSRLWRINESTFSYSGLKTVIVPYLFVSLLISWRLFSFSVSFESYSQFQRVDEHGHDIQGLFRFENLLHSELGSFAALNFNALSSLAGHLITEISQTPSSPPIAPHPDTTPPLFEGRFNPAAPPKRSQARRCVHFHAFPACLDAATDILQPRLTPNAGASPCRAAACW
jgi:hypothetical protein